MGGPTESREHDEQIKKKPTVIDQKQWNTVLQNMH